MREVKVGSRVSYQDQICTIRFIGRLEQWPVDAYGVEWDDPARGKHSGMLDGVEYFTTHVAGAGSFVKSTRKRDPERAFAEAVDERYCADYEQGETLRVSKHKVIENVGFDKFSARQKQLEKLPIVSLNRFGICRASQIDLPLLTSLDLSYNLFTSIDTVVEICQGFENLQTLSLNGNRIDWRQTSGIRLPQITELSASNSLITEAEIANLGEVFPNLEQLTLANNNLIIANVSRLTRLTSLDLSYNQFTSIPNVHATSLNISHNHISELDIPRQTSALNISDNCITAWGEVDKLQTLTSLRLNNNPVYNETKLDAFVVGRCANLTVVNGIPITPRERVDAELFFMSKVAQSQTPTPPHPRWRELCQLHGEPVVKSLEETKDKLSNRILKINVVCPSLQNQEKEIKVLRNLTVQKLKTQLAKQFKLNALDVALKSGRIDLSEPLRTVEYYNIQNGDCIEICVL